MSIQSEITRIESEVGTQADLISQLQTVLQGKTAGGGASLDTCTLNLTFAKSSGAEYRYETVGSDGKVEAVTQNFTANTSVTVLCNTRVLVVSNSGEGYVAAKENAEREFYVSGIGELYIITAPSGGTATISFMG